MITESIASSDFFSLAFTQLIDFVDAAEIRARAARERGRCDFADEFCDCRHLADVSTLDGDRFCSYHFRKASR